MWKNPSSWVSNIVQCTAIIQLGFLSDLVSSDMSLRHLESEFAAQRLGIGISQKRGIREDAKNDLHQWTYILHKWLERPAQHNCRHL